MCEMDALASLARRLRSRNWQVAVADDDLEGEAVPPGSDSCASRRCTLVGVASAADLGDAIATLPAADSAARTIVNACLVPSTRAVQLAHATAQRRDAYLDAILSGTAREIEAGAGSLVASGPTAVFEQAKPLLKALAASVFHISERPGAAQLMQQINGSLFATLLAATCESYVAGAKAGLDPWTMAKILSVETGRNAASARIIPEQVATRKFDYGKRIEEAYRELTLVSDEARRLGVTPWILDKARLLYGLAAQLGSPRDDITRLMTHYEKWASVEVSAALTQRTPASI